MEPPDAVIGESSLFRMIAPCGRESAGAPNPYKLEPSQTENRRDKQFR